MEYLAEHIKLLPVSVTSNLGAIRTLDKGSREQMLQLNEDQKALITEATAHAKRDPAFDESYYKERFEDIMTRRQEVLLILETQMKAVQDTYDQIDKKISSFDEKTVKIVHLFPHMNGSTEVYKERKKKKRKESEKESPVATDTSAFFDNEPLYCTCKQVSYGQMIGCENTECPVEWYHFQCVGIEEEPSDPWYCQFCRPTEG